MRLLLLLLAAGRLLGSGGPLSTPAAATPELPRGNCGTPTRVENAEVPNSNGNRFRYSCTKNYKRKAGTSSLAVCRKNNGTGKFQWEVNLRCIRDPSLPDTTTEDPRREADPSTPATPQAADVNTSVAPSPALYDSETPSPSTSTAALLRTAKPTRPGRATASTTAPEVGRHTPGTTSKSSEKCESATVNVTSKHDTSGDTTTAMPSSRNPGVTPEPTAPLPPIESRTGFLSFRIAVPCLVIVALLAGYLAFWYCRISRFAQRRADILLEEQISMAAIRPEEGDQAPPAAGSPDDVRPTDEGVQILLPHCSPSNG